MTMDEIDRAIIAELEQDGRISNVELADRVRLTPAPCLRRVQRLEADGVIRGYRAVIDPESVGRGFQVIVDVDISNEIGNVEAFERTLSDFDEVAEIHRMFGSPDYLVRIAVEDLDAYERFLTRHVLTLPGIMRVNSRFTMKTVKPDGGSAR
ncbi:Lrp/AsnC family transcriptional regulator [Salininema proteolyticum]|uniref:Lrp/AsnC family transcriptional regulator n=1 Tax=Salininema proteolyticum TaxID=1607685 RepID=A0ABV8U1E2_9ACTN